MRYLYISIILSVLGALFMISWGLDQVVSENTQYEENTDIVLYKKLIESYSQQLDALLISNQHSSQPIELLLQKNITKLSEQQQIKLTLEQSNNISLPASLSEQLNHFGGLLLGSDVNPYLLKKLPSHPDYLLQLHIPVTSAQTEQENLILTSLLYLGLCLIILVWLFPLTRRLYIMTNTAAQIGAGELQARLPKSYISYIKPLEKSFNRMAAQIETLVADNKILARSLSHDIRTPLACLRFGIEAAIDTNDLDKKNNYIARMDTEITRMEDMTSAFLEYAAMERKGLNLKRKKSNVCQLIQTIVNDFSSLAEQKNINLKHQLPKKSLYAEIDLHWSYLAIQNLLTNAFQYAKKEVLISVYVTTNHINISVEDDGKGIPEEQRDSIFSPFVKLDAERSREESHFGLGLATTSKVMEWHHGNISATQSTLYSGLCCTLSFPFK